MAYDKCFRVFWSILLWALWTLQVHMVPCSNIYSRCVFLLDQKHVFHIRYKKLVQLQITERQILYFSLYISTFRLLFTIGGGAVLKFCRKWKCLWAVLWLVVLWVDYSKVIHCDSISLFLPWLVVIGVDDTKVIYHYSVSLVLLCSTHCLLYSTCILLVLDILQPVYITSICFPFMHHFAAFAFQSHIFNSRAFVLYRILVKNSHFS